MRSRAFRHCCLVQSQRYYKTHNNDNTSCVRYYVRAVDWSNPAGGKSPKKKRWIPECSETGKCSNKNDMMAQSSALLKFGIIAVLSKNRVIGIDGKLPWDLSEDRRHFEDITRGKVLIIGRNTLGEKDDGSHIAHVRKCIVVSKTLDSSQYDTERILIAASFDEALKLATEFDKEKISDTDDENAIDCWVGGGERIYEEALKHPCGQEVQLTEVDMDIEFNSVADVAMFPRKYTWERNFTLAERREGIESGKNGLPKYTFTLYKRKTFH